MPGVIYEPSGKAREYAFKAVNLFTSCGFHCTYCYVPSARRMTREQWKKIEPKPRKDILKDLEKDARKMRGCAERVLLCFSCDPFQDVGDNSHTIRRALEILRENDVPFTTLTKAGFLAVDYLPIYGPNDRFGVSLSFANELDRGKWEPGAASIDARMATLALAKRMGVSTWVSLEPVIYPKQSLALIHRTRQFTDVFKVGAWSGDSRAKDVDYRTFAQEALKLFDRFLSRYFIKAALAEHLQGIEFRNYDDRRVRR